MPRKQRFKPSRKPKPVTEETQSPVTDRTSSSKGTTGLASSSREAEQHELHPDEVEREDLEEGPPRH